MNSYTFLRGASVRGSGVQWLCWAAMLAAVRPATANIFTEDAGSESRPDTPLLQEALRITEYENLLDVRIDHRLSLSIADATTLRITIPTVLTRRASFKNAWGGTSKEDMVGLGETSLHLKHSLWQKDDVMRSDRWAVLGEVTLPTANDDREDDGVEIPRSLQLGSGGFGGGVGTVLTFVRDRHRFSTEWMFRYPTRHDGYRAGPTLDWNLAYWARLFPPVFDPEKEQSEVRGVIELLNRYTFDGRLGNDSNGDEGMEMWVAPGLQWFVRPDLLLDFGFAVPVLDTADDEKGERRWQALISVRILL